MEVAYNSKALEDLLYGKSGNKKMQAQITSLINDIKLHPYSGPGKPELLKRLTKNIYLRFRATFALNRPSSILSSFHL
jgi:Txe/YoeB family toxin of Txe-Axe toxin-antitoxin module